MKTYLPLPNVCAYESDSEEDILEHKEKHHEYKNHDFDCSSCDFNTKTEDDLKMHMKKNHEILRCKKCDTVCKTEEKFQTHTCKIHVKNPSYGSLYMKGWYDANGCTPVYCSIKNTEIAWLHCKQCEDMNLCAASADLEAGEEHKIKSLEHLKLYFLLMIVKSIGRNY